ncbi:MAG: cytochrome c peroxidase [Myxococcota bacterium]
MRGAAARTVAFARTFAFARTVAFARAFAFAGAIAFASALAPLAAAAHFGPLPVSLQGVPVPEVPGLVDGADPIVVDADAAVALGKALFWDVNVGSDGIACASCHFHAGADGRVKNALSPSGKDPGVPAPFFEASPGGAPRGPNYRLTPADFPFHQRSDPFNPVAPVTYASDDVASSSGSFGGAFEAVTPGVSDDACARQPDAQFQVSGVGTRRAMARNAPTVINAVFSYRQFWDGAASHVFNGSSAWGDRDANAGVWVETSPGVVAKQRLDLVNASLASQALGPPVSPIEMGCEARTLADVGRKLAPMAPLAVQKVHWSDSVLAPLAHSTPGHLREGLATTYGALIQQAFAPRYWAYAGAPAFGQPSGTDPTPYTQLEANFPMFFGLALQMYESTLVSDASPFDLSARDANGVPIDLSPSAQQGMDTFRTAHCNLCHIGPVFTSQAIATNAALVAADPLAFGNETFAVSTSTNVVTRMSVVGGFGFIDTGFASNGVTPNDADPGVGGLDPFGFPLSFAAQYLEHLAGHPAGVVDREVDDVRPCDLDLPIARDVATAHPAYFTQVEGVVAQSQGTAGCFDPTGAFVPTPAAAAAELQSPTNTKMRSAAPNSFKIPTLRNVELTGPYMHDGSMATLEQVIEFYTRGGNFETDGKHFGSVFPQVALRFDPALRQGLIDFLESLTDERVRFERAPFDHPEIWIPAGHRGDEIAVNAGHPLDASLAQDEYVYVPPVGADGRATPLPTFEELLAPGHAAPAAGPFATGALALALGAAGSLAARRRGAPRRPPGDAPPPR